MKDLEVRIVTLKPMRMGSAYGFGDNPEVHGHKMGRGDYRHQGMGNALLEAATVDTSDQKAGTRARQNNGNRILQRMVYCTEPWGGEGEEGRRRS